MSLSVVAPPAVSGPTGLLGSRRAPARPSSARMTRPAAPDAARQAEAAHEAQLLQRVAAGDRGAPLEELYDRYERRVWAVGLRRLRDRGAAEDLVQETFVRLWRAAPRFDPERGTVGALLMTIAYRAASDLGRRRAGETTVVSLDVDVADGPAEPHGGTEQEEQLLLRDELQTALSALSDEQREILRLHFQEDLTQAEIASRLDLPLGTVKSRVFYGLRHLRATLSEQRDG